MIYFHLFLCQSLFSRFDNGGFGLFATAFAFISASFSDLQKSNFSPNSTGSGKLLFPLPEKAYYFISEYTFTHPIYSVIKLSLRLTLQISVICSLTNLKNTRQVVGLQVTLILLPYCIIINILRSSQEGCKTLRNESRNILSDLIQLIRLFYCEAYTNWESPTAGNFSVLLFIIIDVIPSIIC